MVNNNPKINYDVGTKEEFEVLETAMAKFLKNYTITTNYGFLKVMTGPLQEKSVLITPKKDDTISEVAWLSQPAKGELRVSSPDRVTISIDDYVYMVKYNPE
jgi:hypothetical protein